jgi:dual-specificity kinase
MKPLEVRTTDPFILPLTLTDHQQHFIPQGNKFHRLFLDLLKRIFVYDPKQRITAKEALKHPWFKESLIDDGTEALRIKEQLSRNFGR